MGGKFVSQATCGSGSGLGFLRPSGSARPPRSPREENANKVLNLIDEVTSQNAAIAVFQANTLTGAGIGDYMLDDEVYNNVKEAILSITSRRPKRMRKNRKNAGKQGTFVQHLYKFG